MVYKRSNSVFEIYYRLDPDKPLSDANVDVFVKLNETKKEYLSTFYTFNNILTLIKKFKMSGECLFGSYFWDSEMFLINDLEEGTIDKVIHELINEGEFFSIFRQVIN